MLENHIEVTQIGRLDTSTPSFQPVIKSSLTEGDFNSLDSLAYQLLTILDGPLREGTQETPMRMTKAWLEMFSGYHKDPTEVLKTFEATTQDGLVIVKDIPFYSHCEHHGVPFYGELHIGYIPEGRILGLSKFKRLVDIFACRFQVQENLGFQIATCLQENLTPKGVMVVIEGTHLCMLARGVKTSGSQTITSHLTGIFKTDWGARQEFLSLIK